MKHVPVLTEEVLEVLKPAPDTTLLDGTLGLGGHAKAFLSISGNSANVIGFDADPAAINQAKKTLHEFENQVQYYNDNFVAIADRLQNHVGTIDYILLDLGIGSHQLADDSRGFSFNSDAPLTMQYGIPHSLPLAQLDSLNWLEKQMNSYPDASDIIERLKEQELAQLISHYGEERYAARIARAIKGRHFKTARELAGAITEALPKNYERGRIHPATRTFQALRLATNRELEAVEEVIPKAVQLLKLGGIISVISFHSLEDRVVKLVFRENPELRVVNKKPITASDAERRSNPRSRSAKLRSAIKVAPPQ